MDSPELLIQQITHQISLVLPIILLIFGSVGCLCNFITFSSQQLKTSSCAFYFLCTAVIELLTCLFGLLSRLANDRMGSTLLSTNQVYCKLRSYLIVALPSLVTYMILLTTIDRFMSTKTEVRYRSFSQLKVAYRIVPIIIIILMVLSSHMIVFFDFYPSCIAQPGIYSIIYSLYLILWTGILPNGLVLLFSFLTLQNLIRIKRRVAPVIAARQQHGSRRESQLVVMMFGQAFLSSCLDLTRICLYSYFTLSTNIPKSSYHQTVDGLLLQITSSLLHINCTKSFYVYTLTSGYFRQIFRQTIYQRYRKIQRILDIDQN